MIIVTSMQHVYNLHDNGTMLCFLSGIARIGKGGGPSLIFHYFVVLPFECLLNCTSCPKENFLGG